MNKIFDESKISTFRDLKELATENKLVGRRNIIIGIDERAIEELKGYIYKSELVKEKDKEIERLKEENTILKQTMSNNSLLINENAFLKERISKAIEYIENYLCSDEYIQSDINSIANAFVKLVDILKGVDKE